MVFPERPVKDGQNIWHSNNRYKCTIDEFIDKNNGDKNSRGKEKKQEEVTQIWLGSVFVAPPFTGLT